jgi:photosystem II stability/assembly factor-like uncharacterized protein
MIRRACHRVVILLPLLVPFLPLAIPGPADAGEPKGGPAELRRLKFRPLGPAVGGRVCRSAGVPGDPLTWYVASAAGGIWKSSDGGIHWSPIFDEQPVSSIGSLAISPSEPNVLYAGSGEANIRGNVEVGNGIYKSSDAGKTWQHVWKQEGQIGTIIVHPGNPDVAFAAVLGHAFGPNPQRGVYRTTDGGKTWKQVLSRDPDTGASDVCFDAHNPRVLFAGLWQARRRPWELVSGGPGSGLYTSRDGGDTWTQLVPLPDADSEEVPPEAPAGKRYCKGLPEGIWGKVGVAVAPSDPKRVYALIEADKGGLFRSDDGGESWKLINPGRALRQRAFYYTTLTIDPSNADVVWVPQVPLLKSIDGGKSFQRVKGPHHGDHHDVWIDPKDPRRIIDSNDGGVDISTNGGQSWFAPPLPLGQFYHINVDNRLPYHISGTMQDIGTASGPSNSLSEHGIPVSDWHPVGGGETGFTASDPIDPNIVYAGEYGGYISRYDHRTRQAQNISVYPFNPSGHGAEGLEYRFQWTAPILISPHDHRVVYHAANVLFRTADAGRHWEPISPDLTRNDKSKQKWSGGPITGDNTGVEVYGTIYAIAESPLQKGLLWAGSDDGLVHISRDGGKNWSNVTENIRGLPEWITIRCIEPSPFDAGTAYLVADAHKLDDRRPYLFRTTNFGKTWTSLTGNLDAAESGYLHVVRADPRQKGLLYLGSERGVWFSRQGGTTWTQLKLNLPTVAVTDIVVKHNDLVLGTNGRAIWILDDLSPLRQWEPGLKEKAVHLFAPVPAVRYRYHSSIEERTALGSGQNPPEGAILHYYLHERPEGEITLEILDSAGKTVNQFTSKKEPPEKEPEEGDYSGKKYEPPVLHKEAGLHRLVWDLRYRGAEVIKGAKVDSGEPRQGPLVLPGRYTLKLTAAGQTVSAALDVLYDPRTIPPAVWARAKVGEDGKLLTPEEVLRRVEPAELKAELEEQLKLTLKIRADISSLSHTVEQIRAVRHQLLDRKELLKGTAGAKPVLEESQALLARLEALEEKMHNPRAKIVYDILAQKGGAKLYSQLTWLFEMSKASDGAPTQGLREVYADQTRLLEQCQAEWKSLQSGNLARLNEQAKRLDLPAVIVPAAKRAK